MSMPYLSLSSVSDYELLLRQGYTMTDIFKTQAVYGLQAILAVARLRKILQYFFGNY